jgi:hypothetical protein
VRSQVNTVLVQTMNDPAAMKKALDKIRRGLGKKSQSDLDDYVRNFMSQRNANQNPAGARLKTKVSP